MFNSVSKPRKYRRTLQKEGFNYIHFEDFLSNCRSIQRAVGLELEVSELSKNINLQHSDYRKTSEFDHPYFYDAQIEFQGTEFYCSMRSAELRIPFQEFKTVFGVMGAAGAGMTLAMIGDPVIALTCLSPFAFLEASDYFGKPVLAMHINLEEKVEGEDFDKVKRIIAQYKPIYRFRYKSITT